MLKTRTLACLNSSFLERHFFDTMGRKRKSDLISNDGNIGVIDLTDVYETEDDTSLTPPARDLQVSKIPLVDVYNELVDGGQQSPRNIPRGFAGRISEAAKRLSDSAKRVQEG